MEHVHVRGIGVPALGLGTWQLDGDRCVEAVGAALELGYRHIDTAEAYGNEAEIGEALAASSVARDDVWLTTKIWNDHHAADDVRRATEESLRRLRTDHVDLLLVHWPVAMERLPETLGAMADLQAEGKVRHLGVSNFTPEQVEKALAEADIVMDQVEMHPFLQQEELREVCAERDVAVTAYSPLARGDVLDDPVLQEIAAAHGATPVQATLRWLLDRGVVAIPKASSREHLQANLDALDVRLTDADRAAIDDLGRGERKVDPGFAPDW